MDDPSLRAAAVFGLAQVHAHVWNLDRSIALWTEAIDLYRQARLRIGVALATKQRMEVWSALGDFDRAATDGETVLRLFEGGGTAGTRTEVLSRLALVELNRGHADAAAAYAARAAALLPDTIPSRRMYVLNDLGLAAIKLDRPDEARARFEAVGELARSLRDPEYEWRADYGLGLAALADRRPADAQRRLEAAIALVERSRRAVAEADLRAAFMSERVKPYESLVDALMAQSTAPDDARARRAFDVAEQARGRALADLLAEARARLTDPSLAALRRDERAFSQRLSDLQKEIVAATSPAERERREAALDRAELDYDGMIARVRRENPAYAALAFPAPVGASDVMRALEPDEALIEFSFGERGGFAWILRRTGLSSYRVPGADRLSADVRLATALATGNDAEGLARVGRRLYGSLIAPAAASLAGAHRLIVVPAGPLERLPLAALRTPDEAWLAERFALSVVPSATVLSQLRRRKASTAPDALLAVAWSGLPAGGGPRAAPAGGAGGGLGSADAEVRDVAREVRGLSGAVRIQIDATEDAFKHAPLDRYRALHLAAHARIDEVVPRRSGILLGPDARDDGLLQLNEIGMLHLNANVVVLATCRSQVGRLVRGEGLMSLSRMFIYAGARSVVASLWAVDDAETRTLMRRFYGALADGYPPDTALQQAQIAMIRQGRGPSTWAAFTVAGHAHVRVFPRRRSSLLWGVAMLLSLAAFGVAVRIRRRRTPPPR